MPVAIEEFDEARQTITLNALVGRNRPLVIRGLCRNWPIVRLALQSDSAFANELAGFDNGTPVDTLRLEPEEQGYIGYNAGFDGFNYRRFRVSITQGLERLALYGRHPSPPGLAIQSALISASLPGFLEQHTLPFFDDTVQPRIWIGNQVTTPAHYDESHNIACVVCGSRRFTLFPPDQIRNLYVGPLDFAPTGAAISMARLDQSDDPRFPRLRQALEHAQVVDLLPGDAIYIPPIWWHHVASRERINALVNYWWKSIPRYGHATQSALGALMHCILTFKSLPSAERAAWKELLDYYVFDEQDPAAHIPDARRGMLGELSPEQLIQLKETIRKSL